MSLVLLDDVFLVFGRAGVHELNKKSHTLLVINDGGNVFTQEFDGFLFFLLKHMG
jgi:hypothetical protein